MHVMSRISPRGSKRLREGSELSDTDIVDEVEENIADGDDEEEYREEQQQNESGRSTPVVPVPVTGTFTVEQASYLARLRLVELKDLHGTVTPGEFWRIVTKRLCSKFGKSFYKTTLQVREKWRNLEKVYRQKKRDGNLSRIYLLIDALMFGTNDGPDIQTEEGEALTVVNICSLPPSSSKSPHKRQRTPVPRLRYASAGLPFSPESNHVVYQSAPHAEAPPRNEGLLEVLTTLKTLVSNQERLLQQQERLLIHQERILTTQDNTAILQQSVASSFAVIASLLNNRAPGSSSSLPSVGRQGSWVV